MGDESEGGGGGGGGGVCYLREMMVRRFARSGLFCYEVSDSLDAHFLFGV